MEPMTVVMWIVAGAVGGFLHWIIPTKGDKPDDWVELARRIAAGAIAVPAVMATGLSAFPHLADFANYGYVGEILLGYFSVDIWKMFRDGLAEAESVASVAEGEQPDKTTGDTDSNAEDKEDKS